MFICQTMCRDGALPGFAMLHPREETITTCAAPEIWYKFRPDQTSGSRGCPDFLPSPSLLSSKPPRSPRFVRRFCEARLGRGAHILRPSLEEFLPRSAAGAGSVPTIFAGHDREPCAADKNRG